MARKFLISRKAAKEIKKSGGKLTKKQAGSLGGQKTLEVRGENHFRRNAVLGAKAFHQKYKWVPIGTSDFALSIRETGELTGKTINGNILQPRGWQP